MLTIRRVPETTSGAGFCTGTSNGEERTCRRNDATFSERDLDRHLSKPTYD